MTCVDAECFVATHPELYHMTEGNAWPNIRKHGLWSTEALLDMCGKRGQERRKLVSRIRPESVAMEGSACGKVAIRDQKPLREVMLRRVLVNMTVPQYCRLLNKRVFFWANKNRLATLSRAKLYRDRPHNVLVADARTLVAGYEEKISLCTINSGTVVVHGKRGRGTFKRIRAYPCEGCKRQCSKQIAEVTVDGGIPDIRQHVIRVESWKNGAKIKTVWRRAGGTTRGLRTRH